MSTMSRRYSVPLRVLGFLALFLAGCVLLSALFTSEFSPSKKPQFRLAGALAGVGGSLLIVNFACFALPQLLRDWRSPTRRRRAGLVRPADSNSHSGGVLVLALVLLALMTVLLVQAQALARGRLRQEETAERRATLQRAATDAVWAALQRIADDPDLAVDTTNETWALREEVTTPLGISTLTQVHDGSSRFDLNNLARPVARPVRPAEDIVMDLLTLCGDFTPVARVAALTDYMDRDPAGLYEQDYCAKQVPPVACPNRPLYGWGELAGVAGWGREAFVRKPRLGLARTFEADLVEVVNLLPVPREKPLPINVNTASRETLTGVLGLGQDALVAAILTLRAIKPIRDVEMLAMVAEPGFFESVQPYLDVRCAVFEVQSLAYLDGQSLRVRALASRDPEGRVDVMQWLF